MAVARDNTPEQKTLDIWQHILAKQAYIDDQIREINTLENNLRSAKDKLAALQGDKRDLVVEFRQMAKQAKIDISNILEGVDNDRSR